MEAVVLIVFQILQHTVLKIGEYQSNIPQFYLKIFSHVTRLNQSRANENVW